MQRGKSRCEGYEIQMNTHIPGYRVQGNTIPSSHYHIAHQLVQDELIRLYDQCKIKHVTCDG